MGCDHPQLLACVPGVEACCVMGGHRQAAHGCHGDGPVGGLAMGGYGQAAHEAS